MGKDIQYLSCQTCHKPAGNSQTKESGTCYDCAQRIIADHRILAAAVTEYDRAQSTREGYNRYALGMYLQAVQAVEDWVKESPRHTLRQGIVRYFSGRLIDVCLHAVGEVKATREELR